MIYKNRKKIYLLILLSLIIIICMSGCKASNKTDHKDLQTEADTKCLETKEFSEEDANNDDELAESENVKEEAKEEVNEDVNKDVKEVNEDVKEAKEASEKVTESTQKSDSQDIQKTEIVMAHATNHALDKGEKGVRNCLENWKSKLQHSQANGHTL